MAKFLRLKLEIIHQKTNLITTLNRYGMKLDQLILHLMSLSYIILTIKIIAISKFKQEMKK
jgi:hypothetical protein